MMSFVPWTRPRRFQAQDSAALVGLLGVISAGDSGPGGTRHLEVNLVRLRNDREGREGREGGGGGRSGAPVMEWSVPPPAVQWRAQVLAPRGEGTVTPLPGEDIEGVHVNGEVSYRLKNVRKGEPDAALMRVPADFTKPARRAPRASSGPTG